MTSEDVANMQREPAWRPFEPRRYCGHIYSRPVRNPAICDREPGHDGDHSCFLAPRVRFRWKENIDGWEGVRFRR